MIVATTATAAQLLRFQPPLSHGKENALQSFHYSSVTKEFLACMQSFWEHEGISGDESSTDWPSCFIHYPSHTFPSGTGVILASFTMDDNSSFFAQAADVVLDGLATVLAKPAPRGPGLHFLASGTPYSPFPTPAHQLPEGALFPMLMGATPESSRGQSQPSTSARSWPLALALLWASEQSKRAF